MGLWGSHWANLKTLLGALAFTMFFGCCLPLRPSFAQTGLAVTPQRGTSVPLAEFSAPNHARLTLRVYNYAAVDPASLAASEKVAEKIFRAVGLETIWVDCPTSVRKVRAFAVCDTPMAQADFVLRILPRAMAAKLHRSQDALGSAQICSVQEPACELNLFYHRIDELAAKGYHADHILGYAIAHEIAHILLGPSHSDEGIMRASWTTSDLEHISLGLQMDFTADESKQLRLAVLRRAAQAAKEGFTQAALIAP